MREPSSTQVCGRVVRKTTLLSPCLVFSSAGVVVPNGAALLALRVPLTHVEHT